MTIRTDMETKIAKLHEALAKEEAKVTAFDNLGPVKELATEIHESDCNWNHDDGCEWFDDEDDWTDGARAKYLDKAESILSLIDLPTALKVMGFLF